MASFPDFSRLIVQTMSLSLYGRYEFYFFAELEPLFNINITLLAIAFCDHECRLLIGYATRHLFCCTEIVNTLPNSVRLLTN